MNTDYQEMLKEIQKTYVLFTKKVRSEKALNYAWKEYFETVNFSKDNLLLEYKEESDCAYFYSESKSLRIKDLIPPSHRKHLDFFHFCKTRQEKFAMLNNIIYYCIYIHYNTYKDNYDKYLCKTQCYYLIVNYVSDVMYHNPVFINDIYNKQCLIYIDKIKNEKPTKPYNKYAKFFNASTPATSAKMAAEYIQDIAEYEIKDIVKIFWGKYRRTPCLDELTKLLKNRLENKEEKIFNKFKKDTAISVKTLYKWMAAAGLDKKDLTRKTKDLEMHYELA